MHPSSLDISYELDGDTKGRLVEPEMDMKYGKRTSSFSASKHLRSCKKRGYHHLFNIIYHKPEIYDFDLYATLMTQLGFDKDLLGIKQWLKSSNNSTIKVQLS